MIDSRCDMSKMCTPKNRTEDMIVDLPKQNSEKSKSCKKTTSQASNSYKANVVNLANFSAKKDDESALQRILARANKQTW